MFGFVGYSRTELFLVSFSKEKKNRAAQGMCSLDGVTRSRGKLASAPSRCWWRNLGTQTREKLEYQATDGLPEPEEMGAGAVRGPPRAWEPAMLPGF
jgi:hypothetical protein